MRKIITFCIIILMSSCKSTKVNDQTKIIEAYVNQVLLNKPNSLTKRYYEYGIRLKEIEDKEWFIDSYSKKPLKPNNFHPKLSDSLFEILFSVDAIESYNKQLLKKRLDLTKMERINSKLKVLAYSDNPKEKYAYNGYSIDNISRPLMSLDNNFAIVYHAGSNQAYLILFKKIANSWQYFSEYNLIFP